MTQAAAPPSHSTLNGAELLQAKKSCVYAHRVTLVVSDSLQPVDCGLLYQGDSPDKSTGVYLPILIVIPF